MRCAERTGLTKQKQASVTLACFMGEASKAAFGVSRRVSPVFRQALFRYRLFEQDCLKYLDLKECSASQITGLNEEKCSAEGHVSDRSERPNWSEPKKPKQNSAVEISFSFSCSGAYLFDTWLHGKAGLNRKFSTMRRPCGCSSSKSSGWNWTPNRGFDSCCMAWMAQVSLKAVR